MNDLGWILGWSAVRVTLVLCPALGLHRLASRRGPASGAWMAALSLGLVVALSASALAPGSVRAVAMPGAAPARASAGRPDGSSTPGSRVAGEPTGDPILPGDRGRSLASLRLAWDRFERRATGPAGRLRPWAWTLAAATLAGSALGLSRLLIGLWAIGLCRRRGRAVADPAMIGLVAELGAAMGCRAGVEVREVLDLDTPATAGWRRPMLLLPADWPSWDDGERRAVVAHELAHIARGDYAAGILARLAVALNFYHPLVRRMAGRLHLEQELAADAMGARFAGGRPGYLLALSSLALKQDGRSRAWPARAFLPARGTLIRRIAMLRDEAGMADEGRPGSGAGRPAMALGLIALTAGVAMLRAPARAADGPPAVAAPGKAEDARPGPTPFEVRYIPDGMAGVLAFRPAAASRRQGMGRFLAAFAEDARHGLEEDFAKDLGVDPDRPGLVKLGIGDIESVVVGVGIRNRPGAPGEGPLHELTFSGLTARAVAPLDWLAFLRQAGGVEIEEAREAGKVYYRVKGPARHLLGGEPCLLLPDDRTIVCDDGAKIRALLARDAPSAPAYLRGPDWDRASRDLAALALDNRDGALAKGYDLGRADDAAVLGLFRGVERWVVGLGDSEAISPHAEATARDAESAEALARSARLLAVAGRAALGGRDPEAGDPAAARLACGFLDGLKAEPRGLGVEFTAEGFGTLADVAAILGARMVKEKSEARSAAAGTQSAGH